MNQKRLDEPHVSFSQVNCYMGCPLKYRFTYIDQLQPEFVPAALPFGSALHEALADFYCTLKQTGKQPSYDDVVDVFRANWEIRNQCEPVRFDDGNKDTMFDQARLMLRAFLDIVRPGEPLAIEQEFTLRKMDNNGGKLLPLPIMGSIDLIERGALGRIVAVDHKSAAKKYADNKAHEDTQISIYTAAIARSSLVNGEKEFHARIDVLTKTKKPEYLRYETTRSEDDHRRVLKLVREVVAGIEAGVFYPIVSWMCDGCAFQEPCRSW